MKLFNTKYNCKSLLFYLGIELADSADIGDVLEVDMLIGSDLYWSLVTRRVRRGRSGPMGVQTRIGWILSGPVDRQE